MPTSQQIYGDLQNLQNQMQGFQGQMQQYTPVQTQDIYNEFLKRVDNFKPLYEGMRGIETQAYAEPAKAMADYYSQYGQDPSQGRSAMTQLQGILQNIGRLNGTADTMGDIINQQGGRLQQLAGTTLDQYNAARQNIADQIAQTQGLYQNKYGLYQTALQQEEAARQRAAQEAAAAEQRRQAAAAIAEQRRQFQIQQQRAAEASRQQALQQKMTSMPVGTVIGDKVVSGYDAQGNPILSDKPRQTNGAQAAGDYFSKLGGAVSDSLRNNRFATAGSLIASPLIGNQGMLRGANVVDNFIKNLFHL